eukprot:scaffold10162_cov130-Skeletonema_marinoi.AAC.2
MRTLNPPEQHHALHRGKTSSWFNLNGKQSTYLLLASIRLLEALLELKVIIAGRASSPQHQIPTD